jgi:hypothetical protein
LGEKFLVAMCFLVMYQGVMGAFKMNVRLNALGPFQIFFPHMSQGFVKGKI